MHLGFNKVILIINSDQISTNITVDYFTNPLQTASYKLLCHNSSYLHLTSIQLFTNADGKQTEEQIRRSFMKCEAG